jgi:hypothetical protein
MTLPQVFSELTGGKGESETASEAEMRAWSSKVMRGLI